MLRPAVFAIRELEQHYGVTPVLCTATQPVLTRTESFDFRFPEGFEKVEEIIADPDNLFDRLRRVRLERMDDLRPVDSGALAEAIQSEGCAVLCIVNRKDDARELAQRFPEETCVHLSTNMCAQHRLQEFKTIRNRLARGEPLVVVSTSLVEAGVDLDFPVVYRALAGLDSIAQAAGRCNREGRLVSGKTVVYLPERQPQYIRSAASLALGFLEPDRLPRLLSPENFDAYFRSRFFLLGTDRLDDRKILSLLSGKLEDFAFRTAAERFRLINDRGQRTLIVPFGDASNLVAALYSDNPRTVLRRLQRFTVSLPERLLRTLADQRYAHELPDFPGTWYLDNEDLYSDRFGFVPPNGMEGYGIPTIIA